MAVGGLHPELESDPLKGNINTMETTINMQSINEYVMEIELMIRVIKYHTCDIMINPPYKNNYKQNYH